MAGGKAVGDKKPASTAGKAPASKGELICRVFDRKGIGTRVLTRGSCHVAAEAKKSTAAKKSSAPVDGDKKKRKKVRKETYSSYIYKGT